MIFSQETKHRARIGEDPFKSQTKLTGYTAGQIFERTNSNQKESKPNVGNEVIITIPDE